MSDFILVPELLELVLVQLDRQSLARLSPASQYLFRAVTPYLWEHVVCSPFDLLSLINGAIVNDDICTVSMPPSTTDHAPSRLNIYSQHIIKLGIRTLPPLEPLVDNTGAFARFAKQHTLLPNLKVLSVETYNYPRCTLGWVAELFSSSLIEIRFLMPPGVPSPMTLYTALYCLSSCASRCPNLETLELHPYSLWREDDKDAPTGVQVDIAQISQQFSAPLSSLVQIRNLYLNPFLTGPDDLVALSELPNLERLEIYGGPQRDVMLSISLPSSEAAFPKLQHLALKNLQRVYSNAFYGTPISRKLESFCLVIDPRPRRHTASFMSDAFGALERWFPIYTLQASFNRLTSLTLVFEIKDRGNTVVFTEPQLQHLSTLPLEYILVRGAVVDGGSSRRTPVELLANLWPDIKELHWPSQHTVPEELSHLAMLPNLTHLTLQLIVKPQHDAIQSSLMHSTTLCSFNVTAMRPVVESDTFRNQLALFLCHLWPNITLCWPETIDPNFSQSMKLLSEDVRKIRSSKDSK